MNWEEKLKKFYSYDSFIPPQYKIVKDTKKGYDQLIILPTGSGKSICYQLPAIVNEGFSIIISPLKALIKDQIDNLKKRDIPVLSFYGDTKKSEKKQLIHEIRNNKNTTHLIYTTPETIENNMEFRSYLDELECANKLDRFVIDEAHCISQWGNNFRPSYRALKKIRNYWSTTPIMALTATAPPKVQTDIIDLLQFRKYKVYTKSYFRKNLDISIIKKKPNKNGYDKNILYLILEERFSDLCGIIYCQTRKKCEKLSEYLNSNGLNTKAYHAGLKNKNRIDIETLWKTNEVNIIIATIAFGMGIDKSDVRFVIHNDMPFSIESYYQEIGRAGRDNLPSKCILYYSDNDRVQAKKLIQYSFKHKINTKDMKKKIKLLDIFEEFCTNITECRHKKISNYLGETDLDECTNSCDNCKKQRYIKSINVTKICFDIVSIIHKLHDSAYKSNICNVFKTEYAYKYKTHFRTKKYTMEIFEKCISYLRTNKFIKEKLIKIKDSAHCVMQIYQLYTKSKQILENNISIDIKIR